MKADRFLFTRQTFVEFPDLRVVGAWVRRLEEDHRRQSRSSRTSCGATALLFDFKNKDGVRLQGILAIPDDYKPGEKRPMIVTFYEKNSQNMHVYTPPVYMVSMGRMPTQAVSDGYLTMMPDVHFRTGSSHSDMLECVEAATRKVIEMGYADPKRIGVTGHSYGGEGAAYVGTMSKMFAAVGMGAGVVDLSNDFAMNWGWSYGVQSGSGDTAFQVLPLRPGALGLLAVGPARPVPQRVGAHVGAESGCAVPDHARHVRPDRRLHQRPGLLQCAALQREEGGAAGVPERGTPPRRRGEPERPDGAVHGVLRSLPEGRAGAEVAERRGAVSEEGREAGAREAGAGARLDRTARGDLPPRQAALRHRAGARSEAGRGSASRGGARGAVQDAGQPRRHPVARPPDRGRGPCPPRDRHLHEGHRAVPGGPQVLPPPRPPLRHGARVRQGHCRPRARRAARSRGSPISPSRRPRTRRSCRARPCTTPSTTTSGWRTT